MMGRVLVYVAAFCGVRGQAPAQAPAFSPAFSPYIADDDDFFRPTQKPVQVNTYQQGASKEWDEPIEDDYKLDKAFMFIQGLVGGLPGGSAGSN